MNKYDAVRSSGEMEMDPFPTFLEITNHHALGEAAEDFLSALRENTPLLDGPLSGIQDAAWMLRDYE